MKSRLHIELDDSPILSTDNYMWYHSLIGIALYVAILFRLDILFIVIQLTKFQAAP